MALIDSDSREEAIVVESEVKASALDVFRQPKLKIIQLTMMPLNSCSSQSCFSLRALPCT